MTSLMRPLALLFTVLAVALTPAVAGAQTNDPFGPLPQAATPTPTPVPTATPTAQSQQDTDRRLLFGIGAALLILFLVIGRVILRDAREHLPESERRAAAGRLREEGPHKHSKKAKQKSRAKTKAQRAARRHNR
jgi:hypothetical protein